MRVGWFCSRSANREVHYQHAILQFSAKKCDKAACIAHKFQLYNLKIL
jgi:hypothetical protein